VTIKRSYGRRADQRKSGRNWRRSLLIQVEGELPIRKVPKEEHPNMIGRKESTQIKRPD